MLLSLVGCLLSPLAAFGQDTLAEIRKRGVINVFVEAQYRPYEFRDQSGEIVGLDIDLARKMFDEGLGVKVAFTDSRPHGRARRAADPQGRRCHLGHRDDAGAR
jgi:ABC-type amino acid transport/signal transduction systems, periplasmic component/domain